MPWTKGLSLMSTRIHGGDFSKAGFRNGIVGGIFFFSRWVNSEPFFQTVFSVNNCQLRGQTKDMNTTLIMMACASQVLNLSASVVGVRMPSVWSSVSFCFYNNNNKTFWKGPLLWVVGAVQHSVIERCRYCELLSPYSQLVRTVQPKKSGKNIHI